MALLFLHTPPLYQPHTFSRLLSPFIFQPDGERQRTGEMKVGR
jgi:hypothetical protein